MLKSMTGYGLATSSTDNFEITTEIKTLNSKFADVSIKIPPQWSSLELTLRKQLTEALIRGKIVMSVDIVSKKTDDTLLFDEPLLGKYFTQFKKASAHLGSSAPDLFGLALLAPGVLKTSEDQLDIDISDNIKESVEEAIKKCDLFRVQEGKELGEKLTGYLHRINDLTAKIELFDKSRIMRVEEKIRVGLAKSKTAVEIDENRFEQELIYYIEKLDINEEKVRLSNHLTYYAEVMGENQPNGKKMGFIAQELGREINTIGSKANDADIQRIVVEMKEELEKIKEQVLNIL
jgi:uncharacterized protein (TIGR00255 family)